MSEESKIFFKTKFFKSIRITLILLLVLEVFVFNYKSFVINPFNSGHYKTTVFDAGKAEISGLQKENGSKYKVTAIEGQEPYAIFHVNKDVKTMRLVASYTAPEKKNKELVGDIAFSCVGYTEYRVNNKSFHVLKSDERSQYVTNASPDGVKDVKITFKLDKDDEIEFKEFSVNESIPFKFSIIRFISLLLIIELIYLLFAYANYRRPFNMKYKSQKYAVVVSMTMVLLLTLGLFKMYTDEHQVSFDQAYLNQMNHELVNAFEKGHVYLNDPVPEQLKKLSNPYDMHARDELGIDIKWDHLLFEGKYYSYYGIAPVVLLFLPYHVLTGHYFPSGVACLLFSMLGLLFLGLAYWEIIKRWFKKLEFRMALLGFLVVEFSTTVLINIRVTNFYEIAQSSAFCFLSIGFYFMLSSNIFDKEKIKISRVCLSSIFVSLAVLSRAVSALYAIAMVIWAIYGFIKYKKSATKKSTMIKYVIAFALPYVIFGAIQMAYNYARFHNPLDFGIGHTLTIYDYTHLTPTLGTIMTSIVNFLFTIPKVDLIFPFLHDNFNTLQMNGFYFQATSPAIGLFAICLPCWAYLYTPKAAKFFDKSQKIKLALCWLIPGLIFPIVAVVMTWQYGYAARYGADFAWQIALSALMIVFFMYSRVKDPTMKKWLFRIMMICAIWCIIGNLAYVLSENPIEINKESYLGGEIYSRIQNAIQFWR